MAQDKHLIESELLVVRWKRGDRAAFDGIVSLWERSLFYYLRRLGASEADTWELLQETWLNVLKSLRSLRDPAAFPAFLYRTARNAAITRLRRPEFFELTDGAKQICDEKGADPIADFHDAEQIHQALEQLPLLQREALTLFFLRELSIDDMAVLLGVPVGTVKSRLHYAKQAMREILCRGDHHGRTDAANP